MAHVISLQVPLCPRHTIVTFRTGAQPPQTLLPSSFTNHIFPAVWPYIIVYARITLRTELRLQLALSGSPSPTSQASLSLFLLHRSSLDAPICWPAYTLLRWLEALSSLCLLAFIYTPSSVLRVEPPTPTSHPDPPLVGALDHAPVGVSWPRPLSGVSLTTP